MSVQFFIFFFQLRVRPDYSANISPPLVSRLAHWHFLSLALWLCRRWFAIFEHSGPHLSLYPLPRGIGLPHTSQRRAFGSSTSISSSFVFGCSAFHFPYVCPAASALAASRARLSITLTPSQSATAVFYLFLFFLIAFRANSSLCRATSISVCNRLFLSSLAASLFSFSIKYSLQVVWHVGDLFGGTQPIQQMIDMITPPSGQTTWRRYPAEPGICLWRTAPPPFPRLRSQCRRGRGCRGGSHARG